MTKIKLSQLLEYGEKEYSSIKLDNKIKEKILEKTIYKKSIFSNIFRYSAVFTSFFILVFFGFLFYNNFYQNKQYPTSLNTTQKNITTETEKQKIESNLDLRKDKNEWAAWSINNNLWKPVWKENSTNNVQSETKYTTSFWWWGGWFWLQRSATIWVAGASAGSDYEEDNFINALKIYATLSILLILLILLRFMINKKRKKDKKTRK